MKKHIYKLAIIATVLCSALSAWADVKIKSKQTVSGRSYENTTYIKGKRSRTETMGSAMINITQCDLRRGIQINPTTKTYFINEFAQQSGAATSVASVQGDEGVVRAGGKVVTTITTKDTGERKQMFGYTAKHLIIIMETVSSPDACTPNNSKMETDGWYIDSDFVLDCDLGYQSSTNPYGQKGGCQDKYEVKQNGSIKRGYPVYEKMTMFDQSGKEIMSMVNEVVELSKAALEIALFETPADFRQVTDSAQMYSATPANSVSAGQPTTSSVGERRNDSTISRNARSIGQETASATGPELSPKKSGVVRIGLAPVKTGSVGDGITATDLAAAVQNSLIQYLRVPNLEVVPLDSKLTSLIDSEAKEKECDFIVFVNVSHKKGGGGLGMFGSAFGNAVGAVGIGHTGSTAGNIAGQVATQAIVSAANVSGNNKAKDQITLDLRVQKTGGDVIMSKQFAAKAKSNGDDIISQVIEPAAQAVMDATHN